MSVLLLVLSLVASFAHAACTSPAGIAGQISWISAQSKIMWCDGTNWIDTSNGILSACSGSPAGLINYSAGAYRYCDGTNWISMKGSSAGSCSGVAAGTMNYAAGGNYRFCDGTNWYNTVTASGAPTYVGTASTAYTTRASSVTSPSFSVQGGDLLVVYAMNENSQLVMTVTGGSLTWTKQVDVGANNGNNSGTQIWTAVVDTAKSMTFSIAASNTALSYGGTVTIWRNHGGVGVSAGALSDGGPSVGLTTTKASSAVVVANADWNAVSGSGRTWMASAGSFSEVTYALQSSLYTAYGGYHTNVGAVGAKTIGMSAPTGQHGSIAALEVKGP